MAAGGRIVTVGRVAFEVFSGMDILSKDEELTERSHREGRDGFGLTLARGAHPTSDYQSDPSQ
jgi:hypothetical protein